MYYITINVQYVRYSTGRKIKYFIVYRLSFIVYLPLLKGNVWRIAGWALDLPLG
jgi:hypothetical protein